MSEDSAKYKTVQDWVDYIQTLHAREIDLGLERVTEVFDRLSETSRDLTSQASRGLGCPTLVVAGTNGKGSTSAILTSLYQSAGYATGKYTSPHLQRFNERIEINGQAISDSLLLHCFAQVECARGETPLTFFEFGTLVAMQAFRRSNLDVIVLEIGLGGRLDAVNILDHDVAILTNVSLDHTAWLGNTREAIGAEKAHVARANKPLVLGSRDMPNSVFHLADDKRAKLFVLGSDFDFTLNENINLADWTFTSENLHLDHLPLPFSQSGIQLNNATVAIQTVNLLQDVLPIQDSAIRAGLTAATLAARCQIVSKAPYRVIDVSHNQASLRTLSQFVEELKRRERISGRCLAICGMLSDKDIQNSMQEIADQIDEWNIVTIHHERGANATDVAEHVRRISNARIHCFEDLETCRLAVERELGKDDCLLVFGSFHIAGDILAAYSNE